jgi:hypothetical protein
MLCQFTACSFFTAMCYAPSLGGSSLPLRVVPSLRASLLPFERSRLSLALLITPSAPMSLWGAGFPESPWSQFSRRGSILRLPRAFVVPPLPVSDQQGRCTSIERPMSKSVYSLANKPAIPIPVPMHMLTTPSSPSANWGISVANCLVPVIPSG